MTDMFKDAETKLNDLEGVDLYNFWLEFSKNRYTTDTKTFDAWYLGLSSAIKDKLVGVLREQARKGNLPPK